MPSTEISPYAPTYPYTFDLRMFDSDQLKRVIVYAENRARAFSLAALQAKSACNVMQVTLIADNGVRVGPNDLNAAAISSPSPSYPVRRTFFPKGRIYYVDLIFGRPSGSEPGETSSCCTAIIFGRPLAFADAIIDSGSPDHVWQATMSGVSEKWVQERGADEGDYIDFEEGKKYGGVTDDLHDWL